jgi:hypothetical protein
MVLRLRSSPNPANGLNRVQPTGEIEIVLEVVGMWSRSRIVAEFGGGSAQFRDERWRRLKGRIKPQFLGPLQPRANRPFRLVERSTRTEMIGAHDGEHRARESYRRAAVEAGGALWRALAPRLTGT